MHLGYIDLVATDTGHRECLIGGEPGGANRGGVRPIVQCRITCLARTDHVERTVCEPMGDVLGNQQQCGGPIRDRRAVEQPHRPRDRRIGCLVLKERQLVGPLGNRAPLLDSTPLLGLHDVGYARTELCLGVERPVVVILDPDAQERLGSRPVSIHVCRCHGCVEAREREARGDLVDGVACSRQRIGDLFRGEVAHLLDTTDQNDVVHAGGHSDQAGTKGDTATGTGVFDPGGGTGCQTHPVGHDGCRVALAFEQIAAVVPDVQRVDDLRIETSIYRGSHLQKCVDEQIPRRPPGEGAELAHPSTDDGDAPAKCAYSHVHLRATL